MLQDIDLQYVNGVLTSSAPMAVPSLSVGGAQIGSPPIALPSDHSLLAWAADPTNASTNSTLTNGTLYLASVYLRSAATVSKVWWVNTTAAASATAGQNLVGLYSSAGTLLASVSIDSIVTGNGVQSATFSTPPAVQAGRYWVGVLVNAGTPPAMARMAGASASANNVNPSAAPYRVAVNGTGLTAMPATITPASNSLTGALALWAAVS